MSEIENNEENKIENIDVDFEVKDLIDIGRAIGAREGLSEASLTYLYDESIDTNEKAIYAIGHAMLNEYVIDAIKLAIKEAEMGATPSLDEIEGNTDV